MSSREDWNVIWQAVLNISQNYQDSVFIGGVAVNAYMNNESGDLNLSEWTSDIDLCISLAEFGDLRDIEIVTPNKKRSKHQISVNGVDVDVYVEHGHKLAVPYGELFAGAKAYDGIRVAGLEHLMILKLDAAEDRWKTPKGAKDRRDVAKIGWAMGGEFRPELLLPYLNETRLRILKDTARSTAFAEIALGNSHTAKTLRRKFDEFMRAIDEGVQTKSRPLRKP